MKKVILSLGVALCLTLVGKAQESVTANPNPNAPDFKFETEVIDYGTIEHNANGEREFKFTNVGKEPLIITEAHGSCGCTVPTYSKEPVAPGASSVIKVKYATDRVGQFEKTVTITSNAKTPSKVIKIKGNVLPDKNTGSVTAPVVAPAPAAAPAKK